MAKTKEIDEKKRKARIRTLQKGPNLEKYLEGKKRKYTTYGLGASMYSLNYYTFVKLVREAGANFQIKKKVVVDLEIFESYLEEHMDIMKTEYMVK